MVKRFGNYQYVGVKPMSKRDQMEEGSKFWNEGKWDNFVLPFLPDDCRGMTLVDMGCNAGIFLKLAEDKGFSTIIGIDSNSEAIRKALAYRKENKGTYQIQRRYMESCLHKLPAADFTVLANAHYYFLACQWLDYLDALQTKTRYVIIVTAEKRPVLCKASANPANIRDYFKNWDEVGGWEEVSLEGDPFPRKLWALCFKSRFVDRVPMDSLRYGNRLQDGFYEELDKGIDPLKTRYYHRLKGYRKKWPEGRLARWMGLKKTLYRSIKKYGLRKPLIVDSKNRIVEGNHRYCMMKHLGYESVLVRRVL